MPENKTQFTGASVADYVASRANAQQRADCRELMALFKKITRRSPRMWGPSIIGFGSLGYSLASGRKGEMPMAAFAIRGRELVVYVSAEGARRSSRMSSYRRQRGRGGVLTMRTLPFARSAGWWSAHPPARRPCAGVLPGRWGPCLAVRTSHAAIFNRATSRR